MKNKHKIRIGMVSLGCPKTLVDSENILGKIKGAHFCLADRLEDSDVVILNTCGFIKDAKEESIDALLKLIELKRDKKLCGLVVVGCLVQRYASELEKEFPEVDAFVGSGDYGKIADVLKNVAAGQKQILVHHQGYLARADEKRVALTPQYFRYLKISEGCNHTCSFCVIPAIRGKFRSRRIRDVVREAQCLVHEGTQELVLIGQDITKFGYDYAKKGLLPELLEELEAIEGLQWIRLLYAYPSSVTDRLIRGMAQSRKICHYLDLPLQHINDRILSVMRRGITKRKTVELVRKFREALPDLVIRTSFIVGFPGETEKEFQELLDFMEETKFERLGIFQFSREEGSSAATFPKQVTESVKEKRYHLAMQLQQRIAREVNRKALGRMLSVLIEENDSKDAHGWIGRSYMDAPEVDGNVLVHTAKKLKPGSFYPVTITGVKDYDLVGTI